MRNSTFLYNNEAISTVCIGYVIANLKVVTITKMLLVLPFILHDQSVRKLRGVSYKRSLEEFVVKNPELIPGFSARYLDLLPLSINSITILNQLGIVYMDTNFMYFNETSKFHPEYETDLGKRAQNMFKAIDVLCDLFTNTDVNTFYLNLKIEL